MKVLFVVLCVALAATGRSQVGKAPKPDYIEAANPYLYDLAYSEYSGEKYLVDASGRRYLLAENAAELNARTEAAILSEPAEHLDQSPNLKILIYRDLSRIPSEIAKLEGLEILDLSPAPQQKVSAPAVLPSSFGHLQNLRILNLAGRGLSVLPDWVSQLNRLESLNIENNPISNLPKSLCNLPRLKTLKVNCLLLNEVPTWAADWLGKDMNLVGSDFEQLPQGLGKLNSLERLAFVNTIKNKPSGLKKLPAELRNLRELRALVIVNQELMALPSFVAELPKLEILDLGGNELASLPKEIEKANNLRFINLSQNPWKSLNSEIWKLRGLPIETLVLDNLGLSELPPAVWSLRQLKRLSLCGNSFTPSQEAEIRDLLFPCEVRFVGPRQVISASN